MSRDKTKLNYITRLSICMAEESLRLKWIGDTTSRMSREAMVDNVCFEDRSSAKNWDARKVKIVTFLGEDGTH